MFEEYMKGVGIEEKRRAFVLDCIIRLEEAKRVASLSEHSAKRYVEQAKILEGYLVGTE